MNQQVKTDKHTAALARAHDAIVANALAGYRMAGFPRPFAGQGFPERFYHVFPTLATLRVTDADEAVHLSLCGGLACLHPGRLKSLYLPGVDCIACLDELARRIGGR